jgi:enoyl-CoA hydratase/carnithine racemase
MSVLSFSTIIVSDDGSTRTITLNNPARKNAIGPQMVNELLWALSEATEDSAVRTIVLTGAGDAFCAGGDFGQMTGAAGVSDLPLKGDYADLLLAFVNSPKPIVARVNGHAMGGGLGLVAASHFAIGARGAKLGRPRSTSACSR